MKIVDQLKSRGIQPGLETVTELFRRLGNPQLTFKSIHIAGTNGKGSTAAMLREMLVKAGYKTALYTSPHLHRFSERVVINHEEAPEADLERLEDEVAKAASGLEPTYFEFTTAMAFLYFAEQKPDVAIIEVGLGGRLDATNLVDTEVAVITPLSIDHTEFLGNGILDMAYEKAGIMKREKPVVISRQPPQAFELIEKTAISLSAPLIAEGLDFFTDDNNYPTFTFRGRRSSLGGLRCGLMGRHQLQNSVMALAVAEVLEESGCRIGERAMRYGVRNVRWPARMEFIEGDPPVVIDGTHNEGGAVILADELPAEFPDKPVHLLIGMQATKNIGGFLETLKTILTMVHAVPIREMECFSPGRIAQEAEKRGISSMVYNTVHEGFEGAMCSARGGSILLVAGSLYLAGEVIELLSGRTDESHAARGK